MDGILSVFPIINVYPGNIFVSLVNYGFFNKIYIFFVKNVDKNAVFW